MNGFSTMLKKELLESFRTYRLVVIGAIFVFIGFASPIFAKLTPLILEKIGSAQPGVEIIMTEAPTVTDALLQYHKNIGMMPILVILLAMGLISGERRKNILPLVLAKPMSKKAYVLAKFTASAIIYGCAVAVSGTCCFIYSQILFEGIPLSSFLIINALFILTLWTFLAITLLGSVLYKSTAAAAGFGLGFFAFLSILSTVPEIACYTPAGLSINASKLINCEETIHLSENVAISLVIIGFLIFAAIAGFEKQAI